MAHRSRPRGTCLRHCRPRRAARRHGARPLIAVDTNVLLYAHRTEFERHDAALAAVTKLAEGSSAWALPVFVLSEFLRVATHLNVLRPPSHEREALAALESLLASPTVRVLAPGERYWELLRDIVAAGGVRGNVVHDAAIAAVCLEHGAATILTEDRAYERFTAITVQRL